MLTWASRCASGLIGLLALAGVVAPERLLADVLAGPSSVRSDLENRDALIEPSYRSTIPRDQLPGYFAFKDRLEERGLQFNVEYLALGQRTDAREGPGRASGGLVRIYGIWQATPNGSLTFKLENRHKYTDVSPQDLGTESGALSITGTVFSDAGTLLTNLFWRQQAPDQSWSVRIGQIDVTDFLDAYGLISPYSAFQNAEFSTNPTIAAPSQGPGIAGGARLGSNVLVIGSLADADADPASPGLDTLGNGDFFKSLDIAWTSNFDRVFYDNLHVTLWHTDASEDGSREEDYGATASASWVVDRQWMPFVRAGRSQGKAALYRTTLATGLGYFAGNGDLAAAGLSWSEARDIDGGQVTAELFYRYSPSASVEITPSVQLIADPLLDPSADTIALIGLRARLIF